MADKHKNSIGKDFEKAFTEGINNNDWSGLNSVIVRTVDDFLDGVGDRMNDAMGTRTTGVPLSKRKEDFSGSTHTARAQRELHAERARVREQMEKERLERRLARSARRVSKTPAIRQETAFPYLNVGRARSTAFTVIGGIGLGVATIAALLGGITGGGAIMPLAFMGMFGLVLAKGTDEGGLSRLADRYVEVIGSREYIDIETLALSLNKSPRRAVREIKRLLKHGFFPQGHLDRNCKTFILTDKVFNDYLALEKKGNTSGIIDTTARSEDEQEFPELSPEDSAELSGMIREGRGYIDRFHELNGQIPGVEISAKLDRLEGLLKEIFVRVREHPEQMSRIHELMEYYLPTARKLVEAYRDYDRVSEPGREILEAKKDIENTLDTINAALGKLLNKLFKDSVLDVTTDADVLKTMLVQSGLTNGMDQNKA